ncbi:MAG: class I SAM-dependent methyltransferase [Spirochaetes bacterium]|nr:class I SAM-dependent methyltransferase [Spirochaetota bacterium]
MINTTPDTIPSSREAAAGSAIYSKLILSIYDPLVMLFENHLVWKCPTKKIISFYNHHISGNHLDVGVGTGYFLDKCRFPDTDPTVHLMDLNKNSLQVTAKRIKRYNPVIHHWNILETINLNLPRFDSICIGNILHCLPGDFTSKAIVFENLKKYMNNDGILFGLTILGKDVEAGLLYKLFNAMYNKLSIFTNLNDSYEDLEKVLQLHFHTYHLELVGSVALFSCKL